MIRGSEVVKKILGKNLHCRPKNNNPDWRAEQHSRSEGARKNGV